MTNRLKRDPRTDLCQYAGCEKWAKGEVWPVKITGQPMEPSMRACGVHLNQAQAGGAVVQWDLGSHREPDARESAAGGLDLDD